MGCMAQPASLRGEPVVSTAAFRAGRTENGIVWLTIFEGCHVDDGLSREMNVAIRELASELPCPIMVDISSRHESDASARRYGASPESVEVTARLALIVRSPVARMAGNAFLLARRPAYPTRLFTDEAAAVAWLSGADD